MHIGVYMCFRVKRVWGLRSRVCHHHHHDHHDHHDHHHQQQQQKKSHYYPPRMEQNKKHFKVLHEVQGFRFWVDHDHRIVIIETIVMTIIIITITITIIISVIGPNAH